MTHHNYLVEEINREQKMKNKLQKERKKHYGGMWSCEMKDQGRIVSLSCVIKKIGLQYSIGEVDGNDDRDSSNGLTGTNGMGDSFSLLSSSSSFFSLAFSRDGGSSA